MPEQMTVDTWMLLAVIVVATIMFLWGGYQYFVGIALSALRRRDQEREEERRGITRR